MLYVLQIINVIVIVQPATLYTYDPIESIWCAAVPGIHVAKHACRMPIADIDNGEARVCRFSNSKIFRLTSGRVCVCVHNWTFSENIVCFKLYTRCRYVGWYYCGNDRNKKHILPSQQRRRCILMQTRCIYIQNMIPTDRQLSADTAKKNSMQFSILFFLGNFCAFFWFSNFIFLHFVANGFPRRIIFCLRLTKEHIFAREPMLKRNDVVHV